MDLEQTSIQDISKLPPLLGIDSTFLAMMSVRFSSAMWQWTLPKRKLYIPQTPGHLTVLTLHWTVKSRHLGSALLKMKHTTSKFATCNGLGANMSQWQWKLKIPLWHLVIITQWRRFKDSLLIKSSLERWLTLLLWAQMAVLLLLVWLTLLLR